MIIINERQQLTNKGFGSLRLRSVQVAQPPITSIQHNNGFDCAQPPSSSIQHIITASASLSRQHSTPKHKHIITASASLSRQHPTNHQQETPNPKQILSKTKQNKTQNNSYNKTSFLNASIAFNPKRSNIFASAS